MFLKSVDGGSSSDMQIDVTSILDNWQELTVDNFLCVPTKVKQYANSVAWFSTDISLSYSNGILNCNNFYMFSASTGYAMYLSADIYVVF